MNIAVFNYNTGNVYILNDILGDDVLGDDGDFDDVLIYDKFSKEFGFNFKSSECYWMEYKEIIKK